MENRPLNMPACLADIRRDDKYEGFVLVRSGKWVVNLVSEN